MWGIWDHVLNEWYERGMSRSEADYVCEDLNESEGRPSGEFPRYTIQMH